MGNLQDLAKHRKDILLAEVAAWLHDIGKFSVIHIQHHTSGPSRWGNGGSYKVVVSDPNAVISTSCPNSQLGNRIRQILSNRPPTFYTYLQSMTPSGVSNWENLINSFQLNIGSSWTILQLILLSPPGAVQPSAQGCFGSNGWLPAALGISHGIAHHDKQDGDGPQRWPNVQQSAAFGYETQIADIDSLLRNFFNSSWMDPSQNWLSFWKLTRYITSRAFVKGLGDTRRPMNEVTLQDWMWTVAALYKSTVSTRILGIHFSITNNNNHNLRWRLLSIRTDGIGYMLSAPSIPDLLARKDLLTNAWDRVQKVVEEDYPLGLEVYRDENGPVYVVPDLENLLGLENPEDNHKTLREYLLDAFRAGTVKDNPCLAIDGEIVPAFKLDKKPWKGQPAPKELPPIGEHLKQQIPLQSDPIAIAQPWCHHNEEICTICGLRPQGPSPKAKGRKMCDVCEERRTDRAKDWAANLGSTFLSTIWLSEVADAHHRLALIVGQFDLTHWLSGTLVRSLAVRTPNNQNGHTEDQVAKNPSFARLRRIWETIHRFWQTIAPTETPPKELVAFCQQNGLNLEDLWDGPLSLEKSVIGQAIGNAGPRLLIQGMLQPRHPKETPTPYHTYELRLGQVKIGMLWDPKRQGFVTLENLVYIAKQLGDKGKKEQFREALNSWAAEVVQQDIQSQRTLTIEEPAGYGGRNKEWGTIEIREVERLHQTYVPVVPILAEPRTFMALVPADKAVDVVQAIRTKYEREMGKVRNRLPLHLGVVFADAHTPLRAILDAGRRMLKQKTIGKVGKWEVEDVTKQSGALPGKAANLAQGTRQFDKWYAVKLKHEDTGRTLTWYVPAVMGDGSTEDHWYPYVFWEQDKDGNTDPGSATIQRKRYYQAPNPFKLDAHGKPQLGWLVHAGELEPGDKVYFTPATLDFQWLDSSASRFEIAYDGENGQRKGNFSRRPYLLDELDTLEHIWNTLSEHLTTSQIHALVSLIESRREDWEVSPHDDTFRVFCRNALANAKWRKHPWERRGKARKSWLDEWVNYAALGWLTDAVEIWMKIMKEKPVADKTQGGNA